MGSHQRQNGLDPGLTCNLVRQIDPKGLALVRATPGPDDRLELDSGGLDFVDVGEAHYPYQASIPDEVRKVANFIGHGSPPMAQHRLAQKVVTED